MYVSLYTCMYVFVYECMCVYICMYSVFVYVSIMYALDMYE